MKITKRQLRKLIQEQSWDEMMADPNNPDETHWEEMLGYDEGYEEELVQELINAHRQPRTRLGVETGKHPGEIYIMTGQAEGITLKVVRRGR